MKLENSVHNVVEKNANPNGSEIMSLSAAHAFGCGFSPAKTPPPVVRKKIVRKIKRESSFERRFLSSRGKSDKLCLEVAVVWRDTVLSINQYKPSPATEISVGPGKDATYHVETNFNGGQKIHLAQYVDNHWEILFNNAFEGFVLQGEKKTEFSTASTAEFSVPNTKANLMPGSLACKLDGSVRAKYVFGEVAILVHYVDAVPLSLTWLSGAKLASYAPLIASVVLHLALFSVIFFTTDRVNALMVDRIITSSRFAVVVEQPQDEEPVDKLDEEPPPVEVAVDVKKEVDVGVKDTFAPTESASDDHQGKGIGREAAESMAMQAGLLTQANLMNSMIGVGIDLNTIENIDNWTEFNPNLAATGPNYGIIATGTRDGGIGLGVFGPGGLGPNDGSGNRGAIESAAKKGKINLGPRGPVPPGVTPREPKTSGSIDKRIIQKVVRDHTGELRACYEKELNKTKGLHGRIVVNWIISPQGSVSTAFIKESTLNNKTLENCVVSSIKFWRFPAPSGGGMAKVEYPFLFESGNK